jgi:hypothetical protein
MLVVDTLAIFAWIQDRAIGWQRDVAICQLRAANFIWFWGGLVGASGLPLCAGTQVVAYCLRRTGSFNTAGPSRRNCIVLVPESAPAPARFAHEANRSRP